VRKDCTVGKLKECNKAGDEETVDVIRVMFTESELHVQSQKWVVPLQAPVFPVSGIIDASAPAHSEPSSKQ
jgi:hypothetical protein